jgi:hypothetical protein
MQDFAVNPGLAEEKPGHDSPLVRFFRFIPGCRVPQPADASAAGTMPTRAYRYCEPMRAASAFGWYVFPPTSFSLVWDGGTNVVWTYHSAGGWYPLKSAQFPGFTSHFDSIAPAELRGFSPPFLSVASEPGLVQIWTGLFARSAPGWSLLIRPPANLARNQGCEHYEGIVETDRWFGPLFMNIRLTRTNVPIEFDRDFPLAQVQPIPRSVYGTLHDFETIPDLTDLGPAEWEAFRLTVVAPNVDANRRLGKYAADARRRRSRTSPTD